MKYRVTWETDIEDADNPIEAALKAMADLRRHGTTATLFKVAKMDKYGVRNQTSTEVDILPYFIDVGDRVKVLPIVETLHPTRDITNVRVPGINITLEMVERVGDIIQVQEIDMDDGCVKAGGLWWETKWLEKVL